MKKATREWVRKAEKDYRAAERLAASRESFPDQVCFFCQQSAEKYLKALLEELGRTIPKTHDLDQLSDLLLTFHPLLRSVHRGLLYLTDFAVDIRYPGNSASRREATSALRWAGQVRVACRANLGLRPPRRRKPS
jgi:HEPN domain-containing protein